MQGTIESLALERNAYAAHCRELAERCRELEEALRGISALATETLSTEPEPDVATQGTLVEIDLLACEALGLLIAPPSQEKPDYRPPVSPSDPENYSRHRASQGSAQEAE